MELVLKQVPEGENEKSRSQPFLGEPGHQVPQEWRRGQRGAVGRERGRNDGRGRDRPGRRRFLCSLRRRRGRRRVRRRRRGQRPRVLRRHPEDQNLISADDGPDPFDGEADRALADEDGRGLGGGGRGLCLVLLFFFKEREREKKNVDFFVPPLPPRREEKPPPLSFFSLFLFALFPFLSLSLLSLSPRTIGSITRRSR